MDETYGAEYDAQYATASTGQLRAAFIQADIHWHKLDGCWLELLDAISRGDDTAEKLAEFQSLTAEKAAKGRQLAAIARAILRSADVDRAAVPGA